MDGSWATASRRWLVETVGVLLLAGGLFALSVPVSLGDYDNWGIQVTCGTGYHGELLQAQVDDEQSRRGGTTIAVRPATDYVDRCTSATVHRRAWAVPAAGLGALILLAQLARWARSRDTQPGRAAHAWSADHPYADMHEAQILDRRERSHWEHPLEHEVVPPRHVGRNSGV